jgi:hypothetical protein
MRQPAPGLGKPRTVGGPASKGSRTPAVAVAAAALDRAEQVSALAQLEP